MCTGACVAMSASSCTLNARADRVSVRPNRRHVGQVYSPTDSWRFRKSQNMQVADQLATTLWAAARRDLLTLFGYIENADVRYAAGRVAGAHRGPDGGFQHGVDR